MDFVALMLMACSNPQFLDFKTKKQCETYHFDCVAWMQKQPEVIKMNLSREESLLFLITKDKKGLRKICR